MTLQKKSSKPAWLKRKLPTAPEFEEVRRMMAVTKLNTVCQEAKCPNQWECFSRRTATFLILGNKCTRNCSFCAIENGTPSLPDLDEPLRISQTAKKMGLEYVVLTSVTRDDLDDGGASAFAKTIRHLKIAGIKVEVLIPDFNGNINSLKTIIDDGPVVVNHNIETVPRLYSSVRPQAIYKRSLKVLKDLHELAPTISIKSGLMLGLGEEKAEITEVLEDLLEAGCDFITMGQYMQPTKNHYPVSRYLPPEEFEIWQSKALDMGFKAAACSPFVRSSYKAETFVRAEKEAAQT